MATEVQYIDRDNVIDLLLTADGTAIDLSSLTKIDLIVGDVLISNSVGSDFPIKWLGTGMVGKVQLQLGGQSIAIGKYPAVKLVVYDVAYPKGLVCGTFILRMRIGD